LIASQISAGWRWSSCAARTSLDFFGAHDSGSRDGRERGGVSLLLGQFASSGTDNN
jgi:hypothetical protein